MRQHMRIGDRFGSLTVIELLPGTRTPRIPARAKVQCECGSIKIAWRDNLYSGDTKSCGCLKSTQAAQRLTDAQLKTERSCSKCKAVKPLGTFPIRERRSGVVVYRTECRDCINSSHRRLQKLFPARINGYKTKRRRDAKIQVIQHYGGECACCGEQRVEFLQLDHSNNDGAEERKRLRVRGGVNFYLTIVKRGFPSNYRLLCANCNFSRGIFGYCPHEREAQVG